MTDGPIPREFAGYRIEGRIGRGGMGVVYRATDSALDRLVALKVLNDELADDSGFREQFLAESKAAAALDHPNVVPIYAAGECDGRPYIAMRFVPGQDLREILRAEGRLDRGARQGWSHRWRRRSTWRTRTASSTATSSRPTSS